MRRSSILLLVAIITVTPMAFANPPSEGGQDIKSFAQLDKNQDGQLNKAALPASTMHSQHFAKIDSDGNGSLSQKEVDNPLVHMGLTHGDIQKMDTLKVMAHIDRKSIGQGKSVTGRINH